MRLKTIAIIAACVVAVPVAGAAIFIATFDADAYKPRIIEAVRTATGRELRITGPLRVKPSLVPTVSAEDIGLANAPWGSRPEMATIRRAEASIALLPLLSGEVRIARVLLVEPDILLERLADGRANWELRRPPAPPPEVAPAARAPNGAPAPADTSAADTATPAPARRGRALAIEHLGISGGRVALNDALLQRSQSLVIRKVEAAAPGGDGPLQLDAEAERGAVAFTAAIRGGPVAQLLRPDPAGPPWPIDLRLQTDGARLAVKGTFADPGRGAGYDLAIEGAIDALVRLAPLLPDTPLPPLNDVAVAARVVDRGGSIPALGGLSLRVGRSDLAVLRQGLELRGIEAKAASADQPLEFTLDAALDSMALGMEGRIGPLAALLPGAAPAPWPVRLAARAGEARFGIDGVLAEPGQAAGLDARIDLVVPDLSALSPLAGESLPAIRDITLGGRLVEHARRNGFALRDFAAAAMGSDLSGEISLLLAQQSRIEATLAGRRIDIDALMAARPAAAASVAPSPAPSSPVAPPPPRDGRVIPDTKLPFDALGLIDLRAGLKVAELVFGAMPYRDLGARVALESGHLSVTDVTATLPSSRLSGGLEVRADMAPPAVAIGLRAPAMELASLLPQLGVPLGVRGQVEIDLDVKGRGDNPRAIAATLDGHLGLAMGQGSIDNRLLESSIGELWRLLVPGAPRGGNTAITCAAVRFNIAAGQAQARVLLVDTPLAVVSGSGGLNLAQERLGLRLVPTVRLAGGGISVPVQVGGSFAAPSYRADAAGALGGVAAGVATGAGQGATVGGPLGAIIGGVIGATRQGAAEAGAGECPVALAIARGQAGGTAAPASTAPAPSQQPAQPSQPAQQPRRDLVPGIPVPRLPFR